MGSSRRRSGLFWALVVSTTALQWPSGPLKAQGDGDLRSDEAGNTTSYPSLDSGREVALWAASAGLFVAGHLAEVRGQEVPAPGFDASDIAWGVDRNVVGNSSRSAGRASDWTRNFAIALPMVLGLVTAQPASSLEGAARRSVVYAETFLLSQGLTFLGKTAFGRPRPYAYTPADQRPIRSPPFPSNTFQSMPSGHSSSAWTGAGLAITEHLLHRPEARRGERLAVGFMVGALAGSTSALRVAAGQHFPSDVIVGAGVGLASGIAVPLLHEGGRPLPALNSWLDMLVGSLSGALLGVLAAQAY